MHGMRRLCQELCERRSFRITRRGLRKSRHPWMAGEGDVVMHVLRIWACPYCPAFRDPPVETEKRTVS